MSDNANAISGWIRIKSLYEYQIKESVDRPADRSGGPAGPWIFIYKRPQNSDGTTTDLPMAPPLPFLEVFRVLLKMNDQDAMAVWTLHRDHVIRKHMGHDYIRSVLNPRPAQTSGLVPDEIPYSSPATDSYQDGRRDGWNECRAAMLRNIEERKL